MAKRKVTKKKAVKRAIKVMFDKKALVFKEGGKAGDFNIEVDLKVAADREPRKQRTKRLVSFLCKGADPREEGFSPRYYHEVCKFMPSLRVWNPEATEVLIQETITNIDQVLIELCSTLEKVGYRLPSNVFALQRLNRSSQLDLGLEDLDFLTGFKVDQLGLFEDSIED